MQKDIIYKQYVMPFHNSQKYCVVVLCCLTTATIRARVRTKKPRNETEMIRKLPYLSYSMLDQDELLPTPDQLRTFHLGRTASSLHQQPLCWYPASQ